jgi:PiT family inorganic phosphate transporter
MDLLFIYLIGLGLTFAIAWSLGANDAANPTECAVGSGVITIRKALTLFAVFVFLGALLQGHMVMKTLSKGIVSNIDLLGAFTTVISIVLWLILCTWKGMPVSTTHTTVGAVIGYGLAVYGTNLRWDVLLKVFMGIILSPLVSALCAFLLYFGLKKVLAKFSTRKTEQAIKWLLIGTLAFSAYSFGANDVGNATGVYVSVTQNFTGFPTQETMLLLAVLGSIGIAFGGFTWGYKVIQTVGYRITRLTPILGLSAELSNALVVWFFTTIPYLLFGWGLPISTTHSSVGSIIGAGIAVGLKTVDKKTVLRIVLTWFLTIPCAILISLSMFKLFSIIIQIL